MSEFLPNQENPFAHPHEKVEPLNSGTLVSVTTHERPQEIDGVPERIPIVVVPGYTGTPDVYAPVRQTMLNRGRNVITFELPPAGSVSSISEEEIGNVRGDFPLEQIMKACALIESIEYGLRVIEKNRKNSEPKIDKVDICGHSEGFAVAVIAAKMRPKLFRRIAGYGPVGVRQKENVLRLAAGFLRQKSETKYDHGPEATDMRKLAHEYASEKMKIALNAWGSGLKEYLHQERGRPDAGDSKRNNEAFDKCFAGMVSELTKNESGNLSRLSARYLSERKDSAQLLWLESARREATSKDDFERFFDSFAHEIEEYLTKNKSEAARRGLYEFAAPDAAAKERAVGIEAKSREVFDKATWKSDKPLLEKLSDEFKQAWRLSTIKLHETMSVLHDEHGIEFSIFVGSDDPVMTFGRGMKRLVRELLLLNQPRIVERNGQRVTLVDDVAELFFSSGGHQSVVTFEQTTGLVEEKLSAPRRKR